MQIVIDIPERIRVAILNGEYCGILDDRIFNAIANGTPLEQEPCDDVISRQAVLDIINFEDKWLLDAKGHNANTGIAFGGMRSKVSALPPVTPKQRTWHWVGVDQEPHEDDVDVDAYVGFDGEDNNAIETALDTMHKYQKIEQILKDIPYGGDVTVRRIQEVVEDGKMESEE